MKPDQFTASTVSLVAICLILSLTVCLSVALLPSQVSAETQAISTDSLTITHPTPDGDTAGTAAGFTTENNPPSPAIQTLVALNIVVTDRDGDPVSGANLTVEWDDERATAQTASNGRAFVDVAEGSNVTISVEHGTFIQNNPLTIRDAAEQEVSIDVAERGTATITVVRNGEPIQGANVRIREDGQSVASDTTDERGQFVSGDIEQGEYRLNISKEKYITKRTDLEVTGETTQTVQLQRGSVTLSVQVTDERGGESMSVEDAQVSVGSIGAVRTLGNGEASLSVPVNTQIGVEVTKDGYETDSRQKTIKEEPVEMAFQINRTPRLTVNLENTRVVSGERLSLTVLNEYDEPVEEATVRLNGESADETDSDGTAAVFLNMSGDYELVAVKGTRESVPVTVRAVSDTTKTEPNDSGTEQTATSSDTEDRIPGGVTTLLIAALALLIVGVFTLAIASRRIK